MNCSKCGSNNVNVQIVTKTQIKNKHHGLLWWLLLGWYWVPVKWFFFTFWAFLFKLFGHKKQKIKQTNHKMAICQACGNTWEIK